MCASKTCFTPDLVNACSSLHAAACSLVLRLRAARVNCAIHVVFNAAFPMAYSIMTNVFYLVGKAEATETYHDIF